MSKANFKDKSYRNRRAKMDTVLKSLTVISINARLPYAVRSNAQMRLGALKSVLGTPRSVCLASNRSRGVFRLFKLSRIKLRELGSLGQIPGFRQR